MRQIFSQFWIHLACAVIALWLWNTPVIKPFRVFVVLVHEMCHAGAALATGGEVVEMQVNWNESGKMISQGGIYPVISSAGYVGSAFLGALLIYAGSWGWAQRCLLASIGGVTIGMSLLYTNLWGIDFWFGVGFGGVLIVTGVRSVKVAMVVSTWIGLMLCLYSLYDFRTDLWMQTEQTDAGLLARHWGFPALAYPIAFLWALASVLVMYRAMKGVIIRGAVLQKSSSTKGDS